MAKYLEFLNRESDLRMEIVDAILALGPKEKEVFPCFDNVSLGETSKVLVRNLTSWGVTTSDSKWHIYHALNTSTLIHILKSLENHPRL
jgi:hypothetical protein